MRRFFTKISYWFALQRLILRALLERRFMFLVVHNLSDYRDGSISYTISRSIMGMTQLWIDESLDKTKELIAEEVRKETMKSKVVRFPVDKVARGKFER